MNRMKLGTQRIVLLLATAGAPAIAAAQSTVRVSVADGSFAQANLGSSTPAFSDTGRIVAYVSQATNLLAGDTNGFADIYLWDRALLATRRVSLATGSIEPNGDCDHPALSFDGRYVAFGSSASNLAGGDTNGVHDVFVRDRLLSATERVSLGSAGAQANAPCWGPAISGDGRFVCFWSAASNLVAGDANGTEDVFLRDRELGTTERVSLGAGGVEGNGSSLAAALSADARFVVFVSQATNLVAGDTNACGDVFLRDRLLGTTTRISLDSSGAQADAQSWSCSISADGSCVGFASLATNLVAGDTNGAGDVFVREVQAGTTERVSVDSNGAQADAASGVQVLSGDGRYVLFESDATNLVAADTNVALDVFRHDRVLHATQRVSVAAASLAQADAASAGPALSGDGRYAAFASAATNLVRADTNACPDVFVHDTGGPPPAAFCFGTGGFYDCPCSNNGVAAGCDNSASTGGAWMSAAGLASVAYDSLTLSVAGEVPGVTSIVLQGTSSSTPQVFGDGLRCVTGSLRRLWVLNAPGGALSVPPPGGPSISQRSAQLGDVLIGSTTRFYQTFYRDPQLAFCPSPPGNSWNISSALAVYWIQ